MKKGRAACPQAAVEVVSSVAVAWGQATLPGDRKKLARLGLVLAVLDGPWALLSDNVKRSLENPYGSRRIALLKLDRCFSERRSRSVTSSWTIASFRLAVASR